MLRPLFAFGLALLSAGCEFPRDANGTMPRVRGDGILRAGYTERPPWVTVENGEPAGIEAALIEAFAASLGAKVEWVAGSESSLVDALHSGQIAVLAGGFLSDTRWTSRAALSHAYIDAKVVVTGTGGRPPPADLEGAVIAYRPERPDFAALIAQHEAQPRARSDWQGHVAVAYDFELSSDTYRSKPLTKEKHVILVTQGESAFLYALDRFLMRSGELGGRKGS